MTEVNLTIALNTLASEGLLKLRHQGGIERAVQSIIIALNIDLN